MHFDTLRIEKERKKEVRITIAFTPQLTAAHSQDERDAELKIEDIQIQRQIKFDGIFTEELNCICQPRTRDYSLR